MFFNDIVRDSLNDHRSVLLQLKSTELVVSASTVFHDVLLEQNVLRKN